MIPFYNKFARGGTQMSEKLEKAARGRKELMKNAVALYVGKNSILLNGEKSFLSDEGEKEIEDKFNQKIIALRQIEDPIELHTRIQEIIDEIDKGTHITYISKNSLKAKVDVISGENVL